MCELQAHPCSRDYRRVFPRAKSRRDGQIFHVSFAFTSHISLFSESIALLLWQSGTQLDTSYLPLQGVRLGEPGGGWGRPSLPGNLCVPWHRRERAPRAQVSHLRMSTVPSLDGLDFMKSNRRSSRCSNGDEISPQRRREGSFYFLFAHWVSSLKMSLPPRCLFPQDFFFSISKTVITLLSQLHHRRCYPCVFFKCQDFSFTGNQKICWKQNLFI